MDMNEYDSLVERFGEDQVICRNCINWHPVKFEGLMEKTVGICMKKCFEIDAPGGDPIVLLKYDSNCFTPEAVDQDFFPVHDLIVREIEEQNYKMTLQKLDADLRREAAAW